MHSAASIYIVEDESLIAMELTDRLTRLGYVVCGHSTHGEDAVKRAPHLCPDLILMDMKLAGVLTGIETAHRLRPLLNAPVVFLTAFADTRMIDEAVRASAFGYLVKPFEERELHATLQAALYKHKFEQHLLTEKTRLETLVRERTSELNLSNSLLAGIDANLSHAAVYRLEYHPDGRIACAHMSPGLGEIVGISSAEFVVDPDVIFKCIRQVDAASFWEQLVRETRDGQPCVHECSIRHAHDGSTRWIQFRLRRVAQRPGGELILDGMIVDITDAKRAEAAIRERERLLESINHNLVDSFVYRMEYLPDGRLRCSYVSSAVDEILGIPSAVLLADTEAFFSLVLDEDRSLLKERAAETIRTNEPLEVEVRFLNGRTRGLRWLRLRGRIVERRSDGVVVRDGIATDITSAKAAGAENRILALIAARTLNAVVLTDAAGHIEWVNEGFTRITGYTLEEVRGRRPGSVLQGPETDKLAVAQIRKALAEQRAICVELLNYGKGGRKYWLEIELQPLFDDVGRLTHFMAIERDITERKETLSQIRRLNETLEIQVRQRTEKLAVSEERFRLLAENMRDLLCMIDESGRFAYVSPSFQTLLGYAIEDLLGLSVSELMHPDDVPGFDAAHQRIFGGKNSITSEFRFRSKEGKLVWLEASWNSVPSVEGTISGYVMTARDISERRATAQRLSESEERFRSLVEWSPGAIALCREDRLIYLNPIALKLLGSETADDYIGESIFEIIHSGIRELMQLRLLNVEGAKNEIPPTEARLTRLDGSTLDVEIRGKSITLDGLPTTYIAWNDITARKYAEQLRTELESRMFKNQKFEALGTLAGGIAHDFNNILTGIINYTALARTDCPETHPQISDFLGEVLKCSERARELVRQILLFSRSEETERVPLRLQHVLKEVLSLLRSTIPANVEIESNIDQHAPVVLGNATQLHQVMMNLGINAHHAMLGDGGVLRIGLRQKVVDSASALQVPDLTEGTYVCIEVADNGCGMEPEILSRIFEPFFTTKKVGEGTGLGLAVVQGIVKGHHGAINVRSHPGRGTTFELFFPVHNFGPAGDTAVNREIPLGHGERILLVDDEPIIGQSVKLMLERLGYRVAFFTDPNVALGQFWSAPREFDLVMTDFQMPNMTGIDLVGRVLAHRPEMPVFLASGFAGKLTSERVSGVGVTRFILKPIDMTDLARALAEAFQRSREIIFP